MKNRLIYLFTFLMLFKTGLCQKDPQCSYDFETPFNCYFDTLWIDTVTNNNNVWQIGQPNKTFFQSSYSLPNAIVTRLDTPYPANDTSHFIIRHIPDMALLNLGVMWIDAIYQVNTDSILDYGTIEFSPDNGLTWINLITDTFYAQQGIYYWTNDHKPVLTGNTNGWDWFSLWITDYSNIFNIQWDDTVYLRFTFISDSIQTFKDGWMLDDIIISDWYENIPENISRNQNSKACPNPFNYQTTIMSNCILKNATLILYDALGNPVKFLKNISGQTITLYRDNLPDGLYLMQITQDKSTFINKLFISD